jgi:purine-nucleoside phosphorylase
VSANLAPGEVMSVEEIVEPRWSADAGAPLGRLATGGGPALPNIRRGIHACVPGPQYETPAELALLRRLGADTVSMSLAAEARAAQEGGLNLAVLAVISNTGETTHEGVLRGATQAGAALSGAIEAILQVWGAPASLY